MSRALRIAATMALATGIECGTSAAAKAFSDQDRALQVFENACIGALVIDDATTVFDRKVATERLQIFGFVQTEPLHFLDEGRDLTAYVGDLKIGRGDECAISFPKKLDPEILEFEGGDILRGAVFPYQVLGPKISDDGASAIYISGINGLKLVFQIQSTAQGHSSLNLSVLTP